MKIRNVRVPEGINVSKHRPLADFFVLTAGAIGLFAALGLVALLIGSYAGRYMPMSWENALAVAVFEGEALEKPAAGDREIEAALQALADRLATNMDLPEDLRITVHYQDEDEINAFATLGGHVFVLRGLVRRIPDENALAMVLAHEIAHAANRDIAANIGGAMMMQLVLTAAIGSASDLADKLVAGSNSLLLKQFGREAEARADADGLAAVAALYGHVAGADTFFEIALEQAGQAMPAEGPELLSTHPLSTNRIAALRGLAAERGWPTEGERTRLPAALAALGEDG